MCRKVRKWQKETHHFAKENKPWLFIAEKQRAEETWTFSKNPGTNQASVFFINLHHSEPERMNAGLKVKGHFVLIQLRFLFFYRIFFIDFFFCSYYVPKTFKQFFFIQLEVKAVDGEEAPCQMFYTVRRKCTKLYLALLLGCYRYLLLL